MVTDHVTSAAAVRAGTVTTLSERMQEAQKPQLSTSMLNSVEGQTSLRPRRHYRLPTPAMIEVLTKTCVIEAMSAG
jgi:hypothetical protein